MTAAVRAAPRPRRARRVGLGLVGLVVALLCVGGIVAIVVVSLPLVLADPAELSAPPRAIYPEPEPGVDPVATAEDDDEPAPPVDGQPLYLAIPSAGLEATVGSMRVPYSGQIDPPTPGSAYWIRDYGTVGPASQSTAYIAGHTFRGEGTAVFNALFDRASRQSVVAVGDSVQVEAPEGTYSYTVTDVERYAKVAVEAAGEVWQNIPGRLVLVACQYNGDESSTENLVIYAQLDGSGPS